MSTRDSSSPSHREQRISIKHYLTERQHEVFILLVAFQEKHGFPPSTQELAQLMGVSSPNAAADVLRSLQRKGVISIARGVSRGITINVGREAEDATELLRAVLAGEEYARKHALLFLQQKGVEL